MPCDHNLATVTGARFNAALFLDPPPQAIMLILKVLPKQDHVDDERARFETN